MKSISLFVTVFIVCTLGLVVPASQQDHHFTGAAGGDNAYNRGREPQDWWGEIERMHGHVGPWNVLGWRIGSAALHEFDTKWGLHELDIICYVPLRTPYTCMADGLVIGSGNTIGRLDLRLAEVVSLEFVHICVRRKDDTGPIMIFKPRLSYLKHIDAPKPEDLEKLSKECSSLPESEVFEIQRVATAKD